MKRGADMKKLRLYGLMLCAAALVLVTAGASYAWFFRNASLDSLMSVLPPDTILIIPVTEGGSKMMELDLDFREDWGDSKDENDVIHVLRPVCVKSSNPKHRLQVVHTTNLKALNFSIYTATVHERVGTASTEMPEVSLTKDATTLSVEPINLLTQTSGQGTVSERLAIPQSVNGNYKSGDQVEAHAYPLYWTATKISNCEIAQDDDNHKRVSSYCRQETDPITGEEKQFYYTYYYLEISWKEDTKETDLFYIMAHNVA